MAFFDTFLAKVDQADKAVLDRYPELRASVDKMEADFAKSTQFNQAWLDWQKDNWDAQAGTTRAEKAMSDELAAMQAMVDTGTGSTADVAKLRQELDAKIKATETNSMQAIAGMNNFYRAVSNRLLSHQQEFKENLDADKLMQYMTANNIQDPDVAYDKMYAGRRAELAVEAGKVAETQRQADIAAAEQRGYERRQTEAAMGPGGMSPTDQSGGITGVTAHMGPVKAISEAEKAIVDSAKLGDLNLATLGYQKFLRGEYSGGTQ